MDPETSNTLGRHSPEALVGQVDKCDRKGEEANAGWPTGGMTAMGNWSHSSCRLLETAELSQLRGQGASTFILSVNGRGCS